MHHRIIDAVILDAHFSHISIDSVKNIFLIRLRDPPPRGDIRIFESKSTELEFCNIL